MSLTLEQALKTSPWQGKPRPADAPQWLARAAEVAAILAVDQVARDRRQAVPTAEVQLLKDAGLTTLLGPVQHGGAGQHWDTAYKVIRIVASGDGSVGQLLGYHYLWAWAVHLVGTPAQIETVEALYTANDLFFGGAVNPRDGDLVITEIDGQLAYNGRKSFSTGSKVSDLTVLEGVLQGTDKHIFAIVPSKQDGIVYHDDWDHLGQRLTESGGVTINDVRIDWASAAGYVDKVYQQRAYETLNLPAIQLVFANFYLGIAEGALKTAAGYTREKTRAWPYGGDNKEAAGEEWYILEAYGTLQSRLWAAEELANSVGAEISTLLHADRDALTPAARGRVAVRIAAAKQAAVDIGLEIGTKVFEVTGARATANAVGLDIFWRNIRTHSLHDPIAYKRREVGAYALRGQIPEPSWYT
ncbi:alkylation response protein AidB-like acyl-CoA dehydrogenase [Variovorax beijingensis]|uniref:Alkylation response protein AidB-like acyl-CoA dehydrogenase n=1 Tax=Variovorax beijingensis TaxID=2496117 RepID=A0A561BGT0_9BURK|nr:acyl-CoA dehydrogenase family protein [Variovorax beijingensis]TWD78077.1 alkylation response protein AidB-like acyl-CoA dehydrogenase [Variovorax beijingensis]